MLKEELLNGQEAPESIKKYSKDNVNHPRHYEKACSMECIDAMEIALGKEAVIHFCKGNAFKYLWRYKNKNGSEDLEKALWYCTYADNKSKELYQDPNFEDEQINVMRDKIYIYMQGGKDG